MLFGGQLPAETLQEAIARVGFSVIGELATVLTFGNNIFRAKGLEHLMDDIQEHAVLTAFVPETWTTPKAAMATISSSAASFIRWANPSSFS